MLSVVLDNAFRPRIQRQPSQNADDIGARLAEPSSFSLLISTTGVPKYRMDGSLTICGAFMFQSLRCGDEKLTGELRTGTPFFALKSKRQAEAPRPAFTSLCCDYLRFASRAAS